MADEQKIPPAPQHEIGYLVRGKGNARDLDDETTPELRWPQSLEVFNQMRRTDSQVIATLRAVTLPLRRTTWRIEPNGARDEVVEHVAQDLNVPIEGQSAEDKPAGRTRGRFSWDEHLDQALLALPFGHMFFEQVYRYDAKGRLRIRKLAPRMPTSIQDIKVARDGGLEYIEQYRDMGATSGAKVRIPVDRLVAYVTDREGADWTGNSLLRTSYGPWLIKNVMLRIAPQVVERNGMGVPVYEGAPNQTAKDLEAGREMASAVRAGNYAGASVPYQAGLKILGVQGNLPDPMPVIHYCDASIGKSVLAHFLNLDGKGGSYSLAETQHDAFTQSLQTRADYLQRTANAHIVEDLVDINYGADEPAPRLVFDEIGQRHPATAEALKMLKDAGILFPDRTLEEFVREAFGLPQKEVQPDAKPAE